mmetsp:Transcript_10105/g.21693  ORF Transcript_10105/g.21693 Transcript_10105/m.21693 type:complete len:200 (+) Transcript_10105:706-1305(+)
MSEALRPPTVPPSTPLALPMRMSRGPSRMNEKPRSASLIWCDETPRSNNIPSTPLPASSSSSSSPPSNISIGSFVNGCSTFGRVSARSPKFVDTGMNSGRSVPSWLVYSDSRSEAVFRAFGSTSHPKRTSPGPNLRNKALECPPPPSVPSTNTREDRFGAAVSSSIVLLLLLSSPLLLFVVVVAVGAILFLFLFFFFFL